MILIKQKASFFLLSMLIITTSCKNPDYLKYGRITFHVASQSDYFVYTVDDIFYKKYKNSPNNKKHPRLSDEEYKMLITLLREGKYCLKKSLNPDFEIISRQEKIYDVTFAKVIAESLNSKSLYPVSYYGRCL